VKGEAIMQLKDLCVLDVASCTRELTIADAARLMRRHHTGDLVVVDDADEEREPVGIITDRDIVVEVLAQGRDPSRTTVGEIMSTQLVIASASENCAEALQRMATHGVRRIPVVDDKRYVLGIVTLDDMLRVHATQANRLLDVVSKEQVREQRARR
jgi:CBS domain-containing protein